MLHLTAYINRTNGFGPVHNADPNLTWFSPEAWTSTAIFGLMNMSFRKKALWLLLF